MVADLAYAFFKNHLSLFDFNFCTIWAQMPEWPYQGTAGL